VIKVLVSSVWLGLGYVKTWMVLSELCMSRRSVGFRPTRNLNTQTQISYLNSYKCTRIWVSFIFHTHFFIFFILSVLVEPHKEAQKLTLRMPSLHVGSRRE